MQPAAPSCQDQFRVTVSASSPSIPATRSSPAGIWRSAISIRNAENVTGSPSCIQPRSTNGSTPLREALSRAGRHFAGIQTGINDGMTGDPIQYSCQQNFSILTTDGYWNGNAGIKVDDNSIGNHDGDISITPRPLFDGSTTTTSTRVTSVNEFYSSSGCSSGRQRVRATTTITTTPTSPAGSPSSSSNTNNVTSCSFSPRALQTPNPAGSTTESLSSIIRR